MLPLVRGIAHDIVKKGREMNALAHSTKLPPEQQSIAVGLQREVEAYLSELETLGCLYKDWSFESGLIDFPAFIEGREVFLCWRTDEESVLYYHDINEGYATRKKIPPRYLTGL